MSKNVKLDRFQEEAITFNAIKQSIFYRWHGANVIKLFCPLFANFPIKLECLLD